MLLLPAAPSKRRGRFVVAVRLIYDDPEAMRRVMGECVIVHAESILIDDVVRYVAVSPLFREVEVGEVVPMYTWEVSRGASGDVTDVKPVELKTS